MKHTLEQQENLTLRQAEVTEIRCENGHVSAVVLRTGAVFGVKVCSLHRHIPGGQDTIVGASSPPGPTACTPPTPSPASLLALGLPLRRFKTGTPPT